MDENRNIDELSLTTATWLKQADRFVKDANYKAALEAIANARRLDPTNPYAIAYEERVRTLMRADGKSPENTTRRTPEEAAAVPSPQLEQLSHLAMQMAQSKATDSAEREHEITERRREEEDQKRQEEARREAIRSKFTSCLKRAEQYLTQEDFARALDEVSRALLLDSNNPEALSLEGRVHHAQHETHQRREAERSRQAELEERKRQEQSQANLLRLKQEQEERKRAEEEARRVAQKQKVEQYLHRSQTFLAEGQLSEAQNELAFVVVIDPLNADVLKLQQQIRDAQEKQRRVELDRRRKKEAEEKKKQEAARDAIQKHIENATKLATSGNFTEALRVLTLAYVLDPTNKQIQDCENRVLATQEEAHLRDDEARKAEEEQKRRRLEVEQEQRQHAEHQQFLRGSDAEREALQRENEEKRRLHLSKAQEHLSQTQFEGALAEVALAFMVDPFSDDVKAMEQTVRAAQAEHLHQHRTGGAPAPPSREQTDADVIAACIAEANRLRGEHEHAKALEALARAFIIDPLNPMVQESENAIQKELAECRKGESKIETHSQSHHASASAHIERAKLLISQQSYDDALSEIALGLTLSPNDETLHQLESFVWDVKSKNGSGTNPSQTGSVLKGHLAKARELEARADLEGALDELAKGFVIDPLNAEVREADNRIRQKQKQAKINPLEV